MAYNPYFPNYYANAYPGQHMPVAQPTMPQNNVQASSSGITWVQGESAAKSFPVGAGQSVLLMDSEDSVMYIKSTDQSGMPLPLRVFDYHERTTEHPSAATKDLTADYVSRSEFDAFRADVTKSLNGIRKPIVNEAKENDNAQSLVQSTATAKQ